MTKNMVILIHRIEIELKRVVLFIDSKSPISFGQPTHLCTIHHGIQRNRISLNDGFWDLTNSTIEELDQVLLHFLRSKIKSAS